MLEWALIWCCVWTYVYMAKAKDVVLTILPRSAAIKLRKATETDAQLNTKTSVNATAFVHACVALPLALYCTFGSCALWADPWNASIWLYRVCGQIMLGYFIWDFFICLLHFKDYGLSFLLHSLLSAAGLFVQLETKSHSLAWFVSSFMCTEISTPFLHLRGFLASCGCTDLAAFKIYNLIFIVLFVLYRGILVQFFITLPYTIEFVYPTHTPHHSFFTRLFLVSLVYVWLAVNVYWGGRIIVGQIKHKRKLAANKRIGVKIELDETAFKQLKADGMAPDELLGTPGAETTQLAYSETGSTIQVRPSKSTIYVHDDSLIENDEIVMAGVTEANYYAQASLYTIGTGKHGSSSLSAADPQRDTQQTAQPSDSKGAFF